MATQTLKDLKAKELKVIAKEAGLEFDPMASAETMLAILEKGGITEIPAPKGDGDDGADGADDGDDGSDADLDADGDDAPEIKDADESEADKPKPAKAKKVGKLKAGEFTVLSNLQRNGRDYKPGDTVTFDEVTDEVRSLVEDKVISQ